jgi:hypothetical protein
MGDISTGMIKHSRPPKKKYNKKIIIILSECRDEIDKIEE